MIWCPFFPPFSLRKVRDSNPRTSYPVTAFRVRPVRPLRQLSFYDGGLYFLDKKKAGVVCLLPIYKKPGGDVMKHRVDKI